MQKTNRSDSLFNFDAVFEILNFVNELSFFFVKCVRVKKNIMFTTVTVEMHWFHSRIWIIIIIIITKGDQMLKMLGSKWLIDFVIDKWIVKTELTLHSCQNNNYILIKYPSTRGTSIQTTIIVVIIFVIFNTVYAFHIHRPIVKKAALNFRSSSFLRWLLLQRTWMEW